jgi:predicted HicB family RNase H-like nuclease
MVLQERPMKAKNENENLVKFGVRIPHELKNLVVSLAIANRRSLNDQFIVLIESALTAKKEEGK